VELRDADGGRSPVPDRHDGSSESTNRRSRRRKHRITIRATVERRRVETFSTARHGSERNGRPTPATTSVRGERRTGVYGT
jgi:hypothetical protein